MPSITSPAVTAILARQRCLITERQSMDVGLSEAQVRRALRCGHWQGWHPGVYGLAGAPKTTERSILAACLATGGRASHGSAGWLLRLVDERPAIPTVTIGAGRNNRRAGIAIHRVADLRPAIAPLVRNIPCTTPLQTLVDLAGVASPGVLDGAIDRAIMRTTVTVGRLEAQLDVLVGRRGIGGLRAALARRGYTGAPHPSVLESQMLRLLAAAGIIPLACEQPVGRFRVDFTLADHFAVEVDGYAYHADPDALRRDHRRRNALRAQGWRILVYTWLDLRDEPDHVIAQVRQELARHLADRRTRA